MAQSPLSSSMDALSRFLVGGSTFVETLERVALLTVDAIEPADFAGITMMLEGEERTGIFTDERSPEIDQAQYDADDGPCLTAFREARVTVIESMAEPGPWEAFRKAAAAHGILSTLSLPLTADKVSVGAMNLYSHEERAFSESDRDEAELFAAQAAIVLVNSHAYWDAVEMNLRLGEAMRHRAIIEQAKGILMGAQACDEDSAFQMLVSASQRENVKLRDIARRIVDNASARGRGDGQGAEATPS